MGIEKINVSRKNIRIISDKHFEYLWDTANKSNTLDEFLERVVGVDVAPKLRLHYREQRIPLEYYLDALDYIYNLAHLSIPEIIDLIGIKKAALRHYLCVSEVTFNSWYYGKNNCPAYYRLLIFKYFNLLRLPHFIYIESDEPKPKQRKTERQTITELPIEEELPTISKEKYNSIKEWERAHLKDNTEVQDLIDKLKYLDL